MPKQKITPDTKGSFDPASGWSVDEINSLHVHPSLQITGCTIVARAHAQHPTCSEKSDAAPLREDGKPPTWVVQWPHNTTPHRGGHRTTGDSKFARPGFSVVLPSERLQS